MTRRSPSAPRRGGPGGRGPAPDAAGQREAGRLTGAGDAALQQGRAAEAEALYRRALALVPNHPGALRGLGIAAHEAGRHDEAAGLLRRAIAAAPRAAALHHVLGEVLLAGGDARGAARAFEQALRVGPESPDTLFSLANALIALGRTRQARTKLERATALAPRDAEAWLNLGNLLREEGQGAAATAAWTRALEAEARFAPALVNLGDAALAEGDAATAAARFEQALAIAPDQAEALAGLGRALIDRGLPQVAVAPLDRALALAPHSVPTALLRARALLLAARHDEALAAFEAAAAADPEALAPRLGRANALRELDRVAESRALLDALAAEAPDHAGVQHAVAATAMRVGRFDEARTALERALALDPDNIAALTALAQLRLDDDDAARLRARLEAVLETGRPGPADRIQIHFCLGKLLDDAGETEAAFAHFRTGNALRAATVPFDVARHDDLVARTIAVFDRATTAAGGGSDSTVPVFVVGMPRSGTTLVEQIIAAHPEAAGAGELEDIRAATRALPEVAGGTPYPEGVRSLDAGGAARLAEAYLARLRRDAPAARRIVDKMPQNFMRLGLIARLFPQARIVHCRRHPLDTILSCYFQNFGIGVRYSFDLDKLAAVHRSYERLMAHWRAVLPLPILDLRYEDLVADPEGGTRRLLDHVGLPWDPACLDFHRSERPVKTASFWQVRQPVHRGAVARWRRYEAGLAPVRAALADIVAAYEAELATDDEALRSSGDT